MIGVDWGERRLGFAISDDEERMALPLRTEEISSSSEALGVVLRVAKEMGVRQIVLGYPRSMDGRLRRKAKEAEAIADRLRAEGMEVVLWDERLTTAEAERNLQDAGLSRKNRMAFRDAVAAQRILSSYLEASHRKAKNSSTEERKVNSSSRSS